MAGQYSVRVVKHLMCNTCGWHFPVYAEDTVRAILAPDKEQDFDCPYCLKLENGKQKQLIFALRKMVHGEKSGDAGEKATRFS